MLQPTQLRQPPHSSDQGIPGTGRGRPLEVVEDRVPMVWAESHLPIGPPHCASRPLLIEQGLHHPGHTYATLKVVGLEENISGRTLHATKMDRMYPPSEPMNDAHEIIVGPYA